MIYLSIQSNNSTAQTKISPLNKLTPQQQLLVDRIESFCFDHLMDRQTAVFTIFGDAGTGKSVILSHLFNTIQSKARYDHRGLLSDTNNYFLVNHPEVLKVYKKIAAQLPHLYKKDFQRPTSFINQLDKQNQTADITIVDEAHLLLTQADHYNNFYFDNQLTEIIRRSRVVILVFDLHQVLRMKSFWNQKRLVHLLQPYYHENYYLHHQFRMNASAALIQWFDNFTAGKLQPLPISARQNYDFKVFSDAEEMRQAIVHRNNEMGLARIVATSGYPSTLDGGLQLHHRRTV